MVLIMLAIGAVLFYTGRFNFASIQTQGRHVKAAGVVLMLPAGVLFSLGVFIGLAFGSSPDFIANLLGVLYLLELSAMVLAVMVAYILIANPKNAPDLPGVLGEIQRERREQENTPNVRDSQPRVTSPAAAQPQSARSLPSILSVHQAADYLGISEVEVIDLVEEGKLPAARINYQYRIARSNVEDLLKERQAVQG